jgi:hypothetical protein
MVDWFILNEPYIGDVTIGIRWGTTGYHVLVRKPSIGFGSLRPWVVRCGVDEGARGRKDCASWIPYNGLKGYHTGLPISFVAAAAALIKTREGCITSLSMMG